jgi:hypothetical protein
MRTAVWVIMGVLGLVMLCIAAAFGVFVFPGPQVRQAVFGPRVSIQEQAESVPAAAAVPASGPVQASAPQAAPAVVAAPTSQVTTPSAANTLVNPVLHHADSQPPENGVGSFDVGVKQGQIGLAFGWHITWPKGNLDAGGNGCDLVILTPGWYENLQVQDGRYEVYDVPSSDYPGWVNVLGQQRADEQAKDYGCPAKSFLDLPQWESPIPSPP